MAGVLTRRWGGTAVSWARAAATSVLRAKDCRRCPPPTTIALELSNRCNLHCTFCWFHGVGGIGERYAEQELQPAEVSGLLDQLIPHQTHLYLGGGEPFVRGDLPVVLAQLRQRGFAASLTTNGTLMTPAILQQLVELGVRTVSFSVDGTEAVHDASRCAGSYRRLTDAISELHRLRQATGSNQPKIRVNLVITHQLAGGLGEAITALKQRTGDAIDAYRLHHRWFVTPAELAEHRRMTERRLGCFAPGAASHLLPAAETLAPAAIARELGALAHWPKTEMFPDLGHDEIIRYYTEGAPTRRRCVAPFFGAVIKPDGAVRFCPDEWIDDHVLGSIRQQTFAALWNNDQARRFRRELWLHGSFPACKRCSWLYAY